MISKKYLCRASVYGHRNSDPVLNGWIAEATRQNGKIISAKYFMITNESIVSYEMSLDAFYRANSKHCDCETFALDEALDFISNIWRTDAAALDADEWRTEDLIQNLLQRMV